MKSNLDEISWAFHGDFHGIWWDVVGSNGRKHSFILNECFLMGQSCKTALHFIKISKLSGYIISYFANLKLKTMAGDDST